MLLARLRACGTLTADDGRLEAVVHNAWRRFVGAADGHGHADLDDGELFLELLHHSHAEDASHGQNGLLLQSVLPLLTLPNGTAILNSAKTACDVYGDRVDPLLRAVHQVHLWMAHHGGFEPFAPGAAPQATAEQLRAQLAKLEALQRNLDEKLVVDVLLVDVARMTPLQQDRIFAQLNNRGKEMSVADKFKSRLYYATNAATIGRHATEGGSAGRRRRGGGREADKLYAWTRTMDSDKTLQVCGCVARTAASV